MTSVATASQAFSPRPAGYLDTPTMGVPPDAAVRRLQEAIERWQHGTARHTSWEQDARAARRQFAALIDVEEADVALLPSIVPAAAAVAQALAERPGVALAHRMEFRSLLLPFLARFGEERLRWVDAAYAARTFCDGIDDDVAVVLVSAVASADGARPDLARIADAAEGAGAAVVVDASQALGTATLGTPARRLDAVLASGYKGLLGPRGVAYAYVRSGVLAGPPPAPSPYGMADDERAESYGPPLIPKPGAPGLDQSPAWLSWVGALPGLELVNSIPEPERDRHCSGLAERLRAGFERLGITAQQTDLPGPIVSIAARRPQAFVELLDAAGVRAAARAGRVRLGTHLYNDAADVDAALEVAASPAASDLLGEQ